MKMFMPHHSSGRTGYQSRVVESIGRSDMECDICESTLTGKILLL